MYPDSDIPSQTGRADAVVSSLTPGEVEDILLATVSLLEEEVVVLLHRLVGTFLLPLE